MQGLGGLAPGLNRGATMSGNKHAESSPYATALSFGQTSWTSPASRRYLITAIGAGGGCNSGGSSGGGGGGGLQKTVYLPKGAVLVIDVGVGLASDDNGEDTTVTLPDGTILTAGGGISGATTGAGGTATGGDLNVTGNPKSGVNGGDGPTVGDFIGAPFVQPTFGGLGYNTAGIGAGGKYFVGAPYGGGNGAVYITGV